MGRVGLTEVLLLGAVFVAAPIGLMSGYAAWRASVTRPLDEVVPVRTILPEPDPELIASWKATPDREVDQVLFEHIFEPLGTDRIEDLAPDRPFRLAVYQDEGRPLPNRARVDLDRDEKWDERWTILDGIVREVAPDDDERYSRTFIWDGRTWIDEQNRGAPRPPDPANPKASGDLVADTVMAFEGQDIAVERLQDTTSREPFRVDIYQDAGHAMVNRATVDLDRDDRWDERWTFGGDRVTREVSPSDDEQYTEVRVWVPDRGWVSE